MQVKIIADSISAHTGVRLTTFELEYPRFIHSELMTHRMLSKNAASSRAIPIEKVIEQVETNPAIPVYWGANKAGMQAVEEVEDIELAKSKWFLAAKSAAESAKMLQAECLHKQLVNRVLEPFVNIKVVLTGTDFANFFWLRNHADAQPEFKALAELMQEALNNNQPIELKTGEWHLPYIDTYHDEYGYLEYSIVNEDSSRTYLELDEAIKVSVSCCAQVSYRKNDTSLEKAISIYDRLITSKPIHASPTEHQATPISNILQHISGVELVPGITHTNLVTGWRYSANLREWIQYRQLLTDSVKQEE